MKRLQLFKPYLVVLLFAGLCCCSADKIVNVPTSYDLVISNKSQFELHHIYVYAPGKHYKEGESLIDAPLAVDGSITLNKEKGSYKVTVTRLKNKDGPLLAYTTPEPIDLASDSLLEYFDEQFRFGAK